jgi:hypothetical protein
MREEGRGKENKGKKKGKRKIANKMWASKLYLKYILTSLFLRTTPPIFLYLHIDLFFLIFIFSSFIV